MKNSTIWSRVKGECNSFFQHVADGNEKAYLVLLSLYVFIFAMLKIAWTEEADSVAYSIRYALLSIVMWGSAVYLFFIIAAWKNLWKKNVPLIVVGLALLGVTYWFSRIMSTNSYTVVMDVFFFLMACGKDYKKMLRCVLCVIIGILAIAGVGVLLKITMDLQKPENISPGHSLGINYPNTWGYMAFLAMMIAWYLYMRHKPVLTFPFFWGIGVFMYFYISCRTVAVLTAVFPVAATIVDALERRADRKRERYISASPDGSPVTRETRIGVFGWIVVAMPFIAFAFMLFVSMQYKWVHKYLYPTFLYTFAMRFVQGGLYFKTYGLPIFGNPYRSNQYTYVNVNGSFEKVGILDSSFAAYIIMRGLFWLAYTLSWLSFAIWKALKRRDYAIPFLCGIILVFAMMERPGLDMWYNFILLYPLAKVAGKPGTEPEPVAEPAVPGKAAPEIGLPNDLPLPAGSAAEE